MGDRIEYKSLYGNGESGPVCGLLCVGDVKLLLDCGWNDEHDPDLLKPIQEVLGEIDAILISHPDPAHLGALPYLVGKLKLEVPIYATLACHRMGQMFMYDQILSRQLGSDFDVFSLDDVDAAFGLVRQLKYQQLCKLTGNAEGMSVTAFAAGHLIGGAIWQVLTRVEEQIVYATHWNHGKDRHLRRADLVGRFSRPAVFITDACSALRLPVDPTKRNADFLQDITHVLQRNGSVLIPSDTAGRTLELLLLLEHHWQRAQLRFTIVMLTTVAHSSMEFVKSQLEWMSPDISDQFLKTKLNPFELRRVKICHSREQVYQLPKGPKVIIASLHTLSAGLSQQLFVDWAPDPANLIIFPTDLPEGCVGYEVQHKPEGKGPFRVQMQYGRRVPLEGEELKAWQEKQRAQLMDAEPMLVDKSMEDLEDELQGSSPQATSPLHSRSTGLGESSSLRGRPSMGSQPSGIMPQEPVKSKTKETFVDGFEVPEGAAAPMFPFPEESDRERTDYGLSLKPADFRRIREDTGAGELESDEEAAEELPTKVVASLVQVNVRAKVKTYSFDGLTDLHSIRNLLTKLAPRHLVLTFGTPEARQALLESCSKEADVGWQIHNAGTGQAVDLSAGTSTYNIGLSDKLLGTLQLRKMANYRLAWLNARAHLAPEREEGQELVADGSLKAHNQEGSIYIGDVKLSALRKALGEAKISADFRGGMLFCQSQVVIKPEAGAGQLTLQGPISDDYYKIRDVLNAQYHIC